MVDLHFLTDATFLAVYAAIVSTVLLFVRLIEFYSSQKRERQKLSLDVEVYLKRSIDPSTPQYDYVFQIVNNSHFEIKVIGLILQIYKKRFPRVSGFYKWLSKLGKLDPLLWRLQNTAPVALENPQRFGHKGGEMLKVSSREWKEILDRMEISTHDSCIQPSILLSTGKKIDGPLYRTPVELLGGIQSN